MIRRLRTFLGRVILPQENHEGSPPPNLCFTHIPKCAGQSVVAAFRSNYAHTTHASTNYPAALNAFKDAYGSKLITFREFNLGWSRYRQSILRMYLETGYPLVYGHHPCKRSILNDFKASRNFVTVLREPVSRFISNYVYDRTGPCKHLFQSSLDPQEELLEYMDSEEAKWMANLQVSMLGGYYEQDHSFELELQLAKENLEEYLAVGFVDELTKFSDNLNNKLGLKLEFGAINKTDSWRKSSQTDFDYYSLFSENVRDRIRALAKFDIMLFEHAEDRYKSLT